MSVFKKYDAHHDWVNSEILAFYQHPYPQSPCCVADIVTEQAAALPDAPRLSSSNNRVPIYCTLSSVWNSSACMADDLLKIAEVLPQDQVSSHQRSIIFYLAISALQSITVNQCWSIFCVQKDKWAHFSILTATVCFSVWYHSKIKK